MYGSRGGFVLLALSEAILVAHMTQFSARELLNDKVLLAMTGANAFFILYHREMKSPLAEGLEGSHKQTK